MVNLQGDVVKRYGNMGRFEVRNRSLNDCGTGSSVSYDAEAHSTSLIADETGMHWVEIGWVEFVPANVTYKAWRIFYESEDGGGLGFGAPIADPTTPYLTQFWVNRKVSGEAGAWRMHADVDLDGISDFNQTANTSFDYNPAIAETSRRGGTATGAVDHHQQMQYLKVDLATWLSWPNNADWDSPAPGMIDWETRYLGPDECDMNYVG